MTSSLIQGSQEWLEMRKKMIGSSDAPIIMGVSPWCTPNQLWQRKLGLAPDQFKSSAMQRGHDLEDQARQQLENILGVFLLPQVRFHDTIPYIVASLDAIDCGGKVAAEIKCPNKLDHSLACTGEIPAKYFPQLQHQLETCQLDEMIYYSYDGTEGVIVKVYRDDNYIKEMLEKEKRFNECRLEFIPPELTERDYQMQTSVAWRLAAEEWASLSAQIKTLEKKEKAMREKLISLADKKNALGAGIKVSRYISKGRIDYDNIPELKQVKLDEYRKDPIECYKITAI